MSARFPFEPSRVMIEYASPVGYSALNERRVHGIRIEKKTKEERPREHDFVESRSRQQIPL